MREAEPGELRPAWRWGVWIGSLLVGVGIVSVVLALVGFDPDGAEPPEDLSAVTPAMLHSQMKASAWLLVDGAISGAIGAAMLALSLVMLRSIRARSREPGSWGSAPGA